MLYRFLPPRCVLMFQGSINSKRLKSVDVDSIYIFTIELIVVSVQVCARCDDRDLVIAFNQSLGHALNVSFSTTNDLGRIQIREESNIHTIQLFKSGRYKSTPS